MSLENITPVSDKFVPEVWHASKKEWIGAGISAILLGGSIIFPETGVILPSAAILVSMIDLASLAIKSNITAHFNEFAKEDWDEAKMAE